MAKCSGDGLPPPCKLLMAHLLPYSGSGKCCPNLATPSNDRTLKRNVRVININCHVRCQENGTGKGFDVLSGEEKTREHA